MARIFGIRAEDREGGGGGGGGPGFLALEKTAGGGREIQFYRSTGTENTVYSSTGTEKGYPLSTFLFFRAYQKRAYPLTSY